ncbi:hypothetical protein BFJ63_vAg10765 [Fusarium oxysporum f. sp. narcissi]|uniref:Methyltransferase n=1 Tax=Fusarium oxysporum f. sp. narcissi TaxID=451672 RepID=A0A4Q2VF82_FUSOX|nr:hypothetical protein BFJ63_vAg10765 [Fusarium oxysporum f. sp. narcissi]
MHVVRMENNSRRSKNFEQLTHSGLRIVDVSTVENDEQRQKSPSQADLAPIEYDPQVVGSMMDDNSSISSGSLRDSAASITSSILEYRHINGRPFQQSKKTEYCENPKIEKDESHIFKKCCKLFFERGRKTGRTWEIARDGRQEEYMREAGFTDLFSKSWKLPVGGWPQDKKLKQIGLYNGAFIDYSVDAFAIFPIGEILGWSKEEVTVLVSQMRKALREPRALPYFNVRTVYGRKPERTPETA